MSLADNQMLLTFLISDKGFREEVHLLKEIKKLGAKILVICETANREIRHHADYLVELNSGISDFARLILYMPVTQLLGYTMAVKKSLDPDHPKNLNQVVQIK
jgi:glucosamine--fructose-6-phosphate aminotransferase (isomerizing)